MSKTLRTITSVAVGVGVGVVTLNPQLGIAAYQVTNTALNLALGDPNRVKSATASFALKTERPERVSAYGRLKLFGAYILFETASDGTAVDVWAFHEGRIDAIEGYYLGDKKVTRLSSGYVSKGPAKEYGDNVILIGANLGAATETAHAPVVAKLPSIWTPDHRGDGVVTGYMLSKAVKAKDFQTVYPSGGPNQTPLGLVIRAQPVFDWRDPAQSLDDPLSWRWSENAVLHTAHYQLVRNGKTWDRHFAPTIAYWTAAANDADVAMPLKAGGTEPRYRCCLSHRHAGDGSEHKAVLAALLACWDGWMCPREDGALVVHSGRYYAPTDTIGPDQVTAYSIDDGLEDENAVNEIGVTYVSSEHDWNTVDTDPWTNEADILTRGAVRSDNLANQVPSASQARRLAKRRMIQVNAPKRGTITLLEAGKVILSERFINLRLVEGEGTEDEFVAYIGPAEITGLSRNLQTGAVQASWIAADPMIDEWSPAEEEGAGTPVGENVPREPVAAPTINSAEAIFSEDASAGTSGAYLRLLVSAPDREDLQWFARTRVQGAEVWGERSYPDLDASASVQIDTEFVPTDAVIEAEVQYQIGDGRLSGWSDTVAVSTSTRDLPPPEGQNLIAAPSDFTDPTWERISSGPPAAAPIVTANAAPAPNGAMTADRIQFNRGAGVFSMIHTPAQPTVDGQPYTFDVWLRSDQPGPSIGLRMDGTAGPALDLTTEWANYTLTAVAGGSSIDTQMLLFSAVPGSPGTADVYAWRARVQPA